MKTGIELINEERIEQIEKHQRTITKYIMKYLTSIIRKIKAFFIHIVKCRFYIYKRYFYITPFIYLDKNNNVVKDEITDKIKWLDEDYLIREYCSKRAIKIAQDRLSKIYQGDIDDVWFSKWHLIP
jgi:hypothetical protein